jgi:hypothetical protein
VGGNIGTTLINDLNAIQPADIVVLELSSFQLELMTISPTIAAITNITPTISIDTVACKLIPKPRRIFWITRQPKILQFSTARIQALGSASFCAWEVDFLRRASTRCFFHRNFPAG